MTEEDNILNKCGNRRPFSVPEGYFDNLTEKIMSSLPSEDTKKSTPITTPWTYFRRAMFAAAAITGILFCFRLSDKISSNESGSTTAQTENVVYSDEYIDSFLEETMIDDYTFYCSLFDSYNN